MVCHLVTKLSKEQIEHNLTVWNINSYRAVFLLQCEGGGHGSPEQTTNAQIREAARIGMTFRNTAKMMRMKEQELSEYAIKLNVKFQKESTHKYPPGHRIHSLFTNG